jgi:hypothetical protein
VDIWDDNKLLLFIAFVIPGFISIKAYELLFPTQKADSTKMLVDAIAYSCVNYALLLWPIFAMEAFEVRGRHPHLYVLFYVAVLFVAPVGWVALWKYIRECEYFQAMAPHPTQKPWDFVFGQRKAYWVTVTLKGGRKIAGMYGLNSFASSAPAEAQLYLEQEWMLNNEGGFERPAVQTAGVIILASEIETVELFESGEDANDQEEN